MTSTPDELESYKLGEAMAEAIDARGTTQRAPAESPRNLVG
ncbi:MAG: hypothetical protein ABIZ69_12400 [Ilumatobacteraceae bacterium]